MLKKLAYILSIFIVIFLSGCVKTAVIIANLPIYLREVAIHRDIAYGTNPKQKLDLYVPTVASNKKRPVLIFFYGGRWTTGSKDMYAFIANVFVQHGYIVAIGDYRKYPQVKFPYFVKDAAKNIAWIYRNINKYNGDKNNIFVMGHSAGAHIGALAIADPRYLKAEGLNSKKIIKGFIGLAGPYDFTPDKPDLEDMFGPKTQYPQMQVPTFIDGTEPPMLLLWGADDKDVGKFNLDKLQHKIESKHGRVITKIYPHIDHIGIISKFTWFIPNRAPVLNDVFNFLNKLKLKEKTDD